jgi:hypothetical protein
MPSKRDLIRNKAVELIKNNAKGLRYSELQRELQSCFPNTSPNTIAGSSWDLDETRHKKIYKPTRGLFRYKLGSVEESEEIVEVITPTLREEDFYEPFANYLKTYLGECTKAIALGGSCLGKRWGTPDVIGVYSSSTRDVIKFNTEIISAEIKINPSDPITAFGQAIAYRLFSSKVYLVEPNTIHPEDLDRIEALCILFGVGLILFGLNLETPDFIIRVRAQRFNPDMFYVNEFAEKLYSRQRKIFEKLF